MPPWAVPVDLRPDSGFNCALSASNRRGKVQEISNGQLAQLVEQRIENPRVLGSIPRLATTSDGSRFSRAVFHCVVSVWLRQEENSDRPCFLLTAWKLWRACWAMCPVACLARNPPVMICGHGAALATSCPPCATSLLLGCLLASDGGLEAGACGETRHGRRGNLDLGAGLRVAAGACSTLG